MWRPKNWKEINPKPLGVSLACGHTREDLYNHGEKVADAILNALVAKGIKASIIRDISYPGEDILTIPTIELMKGQKEVNGHWVFIPNG